MPPTPRLAPQLEPIMWAALAAALSTLPVLVALLVRRRALAPGRDPAAAWLESRILLSWLTAALWAGWPLALALLGRPPGVAGSTPAALLAALAMVTPLLVASFGVMLAGQDLTRRLRGEDWSAAESTRHVMLQMAAVAVAAFGVVVTATLWQHGAVRGALLVAGAAVAGTAWSLARYRSATGMELHAVTWGELRSRLFTLARRGGAELRQLHVLPMTRSRMANGFAVSDRSVILTDYLLDHLTRREVDAVMAHEIAHLRLRHPHKLAAVIGVPIGVGGFLLYAAGALEWTGVLVLAALVMRLVASRRFEYEADAEAVRLCGDPEALVSGLAALGRVNVMPLDWGRGIELLMTHPSTRRRIARIAAQAGLAPERVAALTAGGALEDARYPSPRALFGAGRAFSSVHKRSVAQRLSLAWLVAAAGIPALLVAIAGVLTPRPTLFWAGAALAFAALLLIQERLSLAGIAALERKVRSRCADDGCGRAFVALAPGGEPRLHEGFLDWDLGLLALAPGRLDYAGEEVRFTLPAAQVTAIDLVPGAPGWLGVPRVRLTWFDPVSGEPDFFCLRPADVRRTSAARAAARRLHEQLSAWRAAAGGPATAPLPADAGRPPGAEGVTGEPLARVTSPRAFAQLVPALVACGAIACAALGVGFDPFAGAGWADAAGATLLAATVMQLPSWRAARAPRAGRASAERPRRAA